MSEHREDSDFISPDRLPHGWELLPLKDLMAGDKTAIKRGPFGSTIKKSFFASQGYKVYEQKNAIYDDATLGNYFVDPEKFDELRDFEVKPGDFIVSCSGTIGRISRLPPNAQPGVINQALLKLTIDEGRVHPKYFLYLFRSHRLQQLVLKDTRGSAMKNLASVDDLKQIRLPLPPIKQQETIVAEIEKQFSRLDEAVVNLKRVKANLKRYKAAVLKAAVEGKLTEDWRKAHPDVEPASELIKPMLAERPELQKNSPLDLTRFPQLPAGWCWARIEDLGDVQLGRQRAPKYHSGQYMRSYLRVQNVFEDRIDLDDVMEMDFPPNDFQKFQLKPGDILLNEGQSPELLGRPAIYRGELPGACFTNTLIRFRPYSPIPSEYPLLVFRAYMRTGRFTKEGTITTNIAHLSAGRFAKIEFPLPPIEEQKQIVNEADRQLSAIDALDNELGKQFLRADHLRQSVLQRAFAGKFKLEAETGSGIF